MRRLTLTHKLLLLTTFFVIAVLAAFAGRMMMESANQGFFNSHEITCEELIKSGPGENCFIEVDSFQVSGFCARSGDATEARSYSYMPISPAGEDFETAETIGVVLQVDGMLDNQSFNQFWRDAIENEATLDGMCSHERVYIRSVHNAWPEKLVSAFVINLDDKPSTSAYCLAWLAYVVATVSASLGMLCFCWWIALPKTMLAKIVVACVSLVLGGLMVVGINYIPVDLLERLGEAGATSLLAAIALAAVVSFVLMTIVAIKVLGNGSSVSSGHAHKSSFEVGNRKLTVSLGSVIKEFLFKDIECLTYTYTKDGKVAKNKPPGSYRLDIRSKGKTLKTQGVLGQGQGPIMRQKLTPVIETIVQRCLKQILDGQSVTIAGLTFQGDMLTIPNPEKGKPALQIPLSSVCNTEYVDEHYLIRVDGVEQPVAKISEETEGAEILSGVLCYFIGLRYKSTNEQITAHKPTTTSNGEVSPEERLAELRSKMTNAN